MKRSGRKPSKAAPTRGGIVRGIHRAIEHERRRVACALCKRSDVTLRNMGSGNYWCGCNRAKLMTAMAAAAHAARVETGGKLLVPEVL